MAIGAGEGSAIDGGNAAGAGCAGCKGGSEAMRVAAGSCGATSRERSAATQVPAKSAITTMAIANARRGECGTGVTSGSTISGTFVESLSADDRGRNILSTRWTEAREASGAKGANAAANAPTSA